jgi:hypothetical protein
MKLCIYEIFARFPILPLNSKWSSQRSALKQSQATAAGRQLKNMCQDNRQFPFHYFAYIVGSAFSWSKSRVSNGSVVDWGTMLQAGTLRVRLPMRSLKFQLPAALWPCGQLSLLIEMSTRNLPGGKGRPVRKADNLADIWEPIVKIMWQHRRFTTLWPSTPCCRDKFTFFTLWNNWVFSSSAPTVAGRGHTKETGNRNATAISKNCYQH